jgi:hypothetical protein
MFAATIGTRGEAMMDLQCGTAIGITPYEALQMQILRDKCNTKCNKQPLVAHG